MRTRSTTRQLRDRATRILTDGLQHSPAAIAWARQQKLAWRNNPLRERGFGHAEIRLGAQEVAR